MLRAPIAILAEIYPSVLPSTERRRRPLQSGIPQSVAGHAAGRDLLKKATQKRKLPARPAQRDGLTAPREKRQSARRVAA